MSSTPQPLEPTLQCLRQVRSILLRLHKALLESERGVYEQIYGQIQSRGEFFQLVVEHEWFSWLRPISQFIVRMDDVLQGREPLTPTKADELLEEASTLLQPGQNGTDLEQRYYHAIQRDPDIALMHAEMSELLTAAKKFRGEP
jgi:hypothetical protein